MPRLIPNDGSQEFHDYGTLYAAMTVGTYTSVQYDLNDKDSPIKDFNVFKYRGDGTCVTLLHEGIRSNNTGSTTALIEKLKQVHPQVLKELISFRSNDECTPLLAAAEQGCLANVTQLIGCGADLCAQTNNGRRTVLQKAAAAISAHSLMYYGAWDKAQSDPEFSKKLRIKFERSIGTVLTFPDGSHNVQWNPKHQAELVKTIITATKNAYLTEQDATRKANYLNTLTNFSSFFQAAIKNPQTFFYNPDKQAEFQLDTTPGNPEQLCFSTYLINLSVKRSPVKVKVNVALRDFQEYTAEVNATLKEAFEAVEKLTGKDVKALAEIHQTASKTNQAALETQQAAQRTQQEVDNKLAVLESKERELKAQHDAWEQRQHELEEREKARAAKDQKEEEVKRQEEARQKQIADFRSAIGTRTFFDRIDKRFRNRTRAAGGLDDGMTKRENYAKADAAASVASGLLGLVSSTAGKAVSGGIKMASNKHEAGKHKRFVDNVPSDEVTFCKNIAYSLTLEFQAKLLPLNEARAITLGSDARDIMYEKLSERVYNLSDNEMAKLAITAVTSSKKFAEALDKAYVAQLKEIATLEALAAKKQVTGSLQSFTAYTTPVQPLPQQQPAQLRSLAQSLKAAR